MKQRIVLRVADAKWGNEGLYRVLAVTDPEINAGLAAFDKAEAVLAPH